MMDNRERGSALYTIQLGSFVLNGQILLLLAFGLSGWAAMRGYLRKVPTEDDFGTIAFHAFVIWFLIWKGSPLLLDPVMTIKQPISLLYFDGGVTGRWMASMMTGLYVAYRVWRGSLSWKISAEVATVFLLGGATAFHVGLILFEPDIWLFHAGYATLASAILLSFVFAKQPITVKITVQRWQWFFIGLAFIWFLNPERVFAILSFSTQQAVSFAIGMVLSIFLVAISTAAKNEAKE